MNSNGSIKSEIENEDRMQDGAEARAADDVEARRPRRRRRPTSPIPIPHWPAQNGTEHIVALRDQHAGTEWLLPHTESCTLGSGTEADVGIDRNYVSRKHCTLSRRGAWLHVADHSKNGTFLDEERLAEFVVPPGGWFRVAYTRVTVATAPMLVAAAQLGRFLGYTAHAEIDRGIRLGASASAVVITGEDGCGHTTVADLLHTCSIHRAKHLIRATSIDEIRSALRAATGSLLVDARDFARPIPKPVARELNERTNVGDINVYVRAQSSDEVNEQIGLSTSDRDVLALPPLRSRPADVRSIIAAELRSSRWHLGSRGLSERAFERLERAPWPGNLDELSQLTAQIAVLLEHDGDVKAAAAFLSVKPAGLRSLAKRLDLTASAQSRKSAKSISKRRHQRRT
jgi:hypothetical protein